MVIYTILKFLARILKNSLVRFKMKSIITSCILSIPTILFAQDFDQDKWFKNLENNKKITAIYVTQGNFFNAFKYVQKRNFKNFIQQQLLVHSCLSKQQFAYAIDSGDKKLEKLFFDVSFNLDKINSGLIDFKEGMEISSKKMDEITEYFKKAKLDFEWIKQNKFEVERFSHMTSIYAYSCALNALEIKSTFQK